MYCWIKHYLHNQKAAVKLEMKHSRKKLFKHGVPQGGVLSPTLFLIFMNDIDQILSRKVNAAMYADDLAIWCSEESVGTTKIRLQETMDNLAKRTDGHVYQCPKNYLYHLQHVHQTTENPTNHKRSNIAKR